MTSLALDSPDIYNSYTVHLMILDIIVKFLVNAVKFIAGAIIIVEIHFCFAMAIDAPTHA